MEYVFGPIRSVWYTLRGAFSTDQRKRETLRVMQITASFVILSAAIRWQSQSENRMLEETWACFRKTQSRLLGNVVMDVQNQMRVEFEREAERIH